MVRAKLEQPCNFLLLFSSYYCEIFGWMDFSIVILHIISFCFSMISLSVMRAWNNFLSRIQDIPPTAFQDLHSLEWIKLYNNLLTTLHYELMEPVLDSLQHIDIHSKWFWSIICIIDDKKFNAKTIWLRLIEYERQLWELPPSFTSPKWNMDEILGLKLNLCS